MKRQNKRSPQGLLEVCAEIRPDDGLPPHLRRRLLKPHGPTASPRQLQYCKAVRRCLDGLLASLVPVEDGPDLELAAVTAETGGASLLVVVVAPGASLEELLAVETRLQAAGGQLRAAVAAEIRRKRTPHLRFRVVPNPA